MKDVNYRKKCPRLGGLLLGLALLLVITGCGYSLVGTEDNVGPGIQWVFVDSFANKTSQAGLESVFRNAFVNQVIQGRRFQLAGSREEADAVIRGSILRLNTSPLSYKKTDLAAEERITVVLEVIFEERMSKKVIWHNRHYSYNNDYTVGSVSAGTAELQRKSALEKLSSDVAERVYSLMLSGF